MNKKLLGSCLALVLGAGAGYALDALAQAKPDVLVKQRQAAMTLQGKYFYGQLSPMARGKIPYDASVVVRNAAFLDALIKMPWDGFAPSTKGVQSAALPAIYEQPAKFKEAQERAQAEIAKLVTISKGGDEAAVKAQIVAVNKACGGCHEEFREKQ